jgi:hypothetical protein
MKTVSAVLLAIATLSLAACGGSTETTNATVTENVSDEALGNELGATDDAFGNLAIDNELEADNAAIDNASTLGGNGLTAVDNSQ